MIKKRSPHRLLHADTVPVYGLLYFDHLYAEFRSNAAAVSNPSCMALAQQLLEKRQAKSLTWDDLYTFDLLMAQLLPVERLGREVWSLRSRYRDIAGLREYEAYLASKPPDPTGQVEEKALRADIEYLLSEIYLRYALAPVSQEVNDRISRRVTAVILVGVGILLVVILCNVFDVAQNYRSTLLSVLFVGAMGGLLSMQQRYQSISREGDPIDNISELNQGWSRLFLPAISGSVFAALFYMLILGEVLQGDLFPELVVFAPSKADGNGVSLIEVLTYGSPTSTSSYAKLVVWSFLAGFAERLVPDTLSSFVSRRDTEGKGRV